MVHRRSSCRRSSSGLRTGTAADSGRIDLAGSIGRTTGACRAALRGHERCAGSPRASHQGIGCPHFELTPRASRCAPPPGSVHARSSSRSLAGWNVSAVFRETVDPPSTRQTTCSHRVPLPGLLDDTPAALHRGSNQFRDETGPGLAAEASPRARHGSGAVRLGRGRPRVRPRVSVNGSSQQ
jgi:hypothetical protein